MQHHTTRTGSGRALWRAGAARIHHASTPAPVQAATDSLTTQLLLTMLDTTADASAARSTPGRLPAQQELSSARCLSWPAL